MDWELILVLGFVAVSLTYIAHSSWKTWFGDKTACGGGCGCAQKSDDMVTRDNPGETFIPLDNLVLRGKERSSS